MTTFANVYFREWYIVACGTVLENIKLIKTFPQQQEVLKAASNENTVFDHINVSICFKCTMTKHDDNNKQLHHRISAIVLHPA